MKERILQFLKEEKLTSAQFAEEIGVQPSGISHIISGRNNPSLEFVVKMLEKYKYLSTDWLLFGKGAMYKTMQTPSLFDEPNLFTYAESQPYKQSENLVNVADKAVEVQTQETKEKSDNPKNVSKIVWFYDNNTFEEFIRGE
jgi:transcriptional regulator with XRE-family HTH domain